MSEVGTAQRENAVPEVSYFTDVYTITSGMSLVVNHGLSRAPRSVWLELKCITAELGYAIGDSVSLFVIGLSNGGGATVAANATQIKVYLSNLFFLNDSTNSNVAAEITAANWNLVIKAEV